jgi:ubiquinone/menaquinone biosynthesis C-methylase UbiE
VRSNRGHLIRRAPSATFHRGWSSAELVADKSSAATEFRRVTEPAGSVGITEATWLEKPPLELLSSLSQVFGAGFAVPNTEGWKQVLADSSLEDVVASSQRITARSESADRLRRLGIKHLALTGLRALFMSLHSPEYRRLPKGALSDPKEPIEYWGYGIYVGRK